MNPCIPALSRRAVVEILGFAFCFCLLLLPLDWLWPWLWLLRQDAAETGPPEARRGCAGKVRRRAHTMCARSLNVHGRTSSEPRSALAHSQGRMPGERAAGGVFLWLPFFAQAKKVTRSPQASGSCALQRKAISLESRLCKNNDQGRKKFQRSTRGNHPHPTLPLKGRAQA